MASALLAGCEPAAPPPEPPVRSVKTMLVDARAGDRIALFSGRVTASDTAVLGFRVGGTVERIAVTPGERVKSGQLLARVDARPYQLEVDAATADLLKAESGLTQRSNTLSRNQELFRKGFVGEAVVEQSEAEVTAARSDVAYRASRKDKALLSLSDTRMTAPFAGVIGEQFVHPNEQIAAGSPVLSLFAEEALQVEVSVPEIAIAGVVPGMHAIVSFGALPEQRFEGTVREIGRLASVGNVYPLKVALRDAPKGLRAGMSAEVGLITPRRPGEPEGFRVPVTALRPGEDLGKGHVFVFDAGAARMLAVEIVSVRDNEAVIKGVEKGHRVVVAGVAFLSDGQPVKLMEPPPR